MLTKQENGAELSETELKQMENLQIRSAGPAVTELLGGPSEFRTPVIMPQPDELALANHWADDQIRQGKTYLMNVRSYDKTGQALIQEWKRLTGLQAAEPATVQQPENTLQPVPEAIQQAPDTGNITTGGAQAVGTKINELIAAVREGKHTPDSAFQELYTLPEYKALSLEAQQQADGSSIGISGNDEDAIYQAFEEAAQQKQLTVTPEGSGKTVSPAPKRDRSVNPAQDDLITAVAKLGGISSDQYRQQVGSLDDQHLMKHGISFAVHKNGVTLDRMREQLEELGYLQPQSEIRDLLDAMQHDGNRYSVQHQAELEQDLSDYPFDVSGLDPGRDQTAMYSLKRFNDRGNTQPLTDNQNTVTGFNGRGSTQPLTDNQNTATREAGQQGKRLFSLTHDLVSQAFPKQTITEDTQGFTVNLKNGATIRVNGTDTIEFNAKAAEAAYRRLQRCMGHVRKCCVICGSRGGFMGRRSESIFICG